MLEFSEQFVDEIEKLDIDVNAFLASFEQSKKRYLRLHPIKNNAHNIEILTNQYALKPVLNSYQVNQLTIPIGQNPFYHGGCYYPQDVVASYVVESMNCQPSDIVCDLCAAPGGKTTQLLEKCRYVVANEVDLKRIKVLKQNIVRWGYDHILMHNLAVDQLTKSYDGLFDKVLLDAPCSSESLLYEQTARASQITIDKMKTYQKLQLELLDTAINLCKDQGEVTYSTCTFNTYENEQVVEMILNKRNDIELITVPIADHSFRGVGKVGQKCVRFYPHVLGEGHFIARFKVLHGRSRQASWLETKTFKQFEHFTSQLQSFYSKQIGQSICLSAHPFLKTTLPIYSLGVRGFDYNGKRWVLNHDLSMNLTFQSQSIEKADLDLKQAYQYLYGHQLDANGQTQIGFICYNKCVLGFYNASQNRLKNLYPKGLRNRFDTEKEITHGSRIY